MIDNDSLEYIGSFGKAHGYKGEINLTFSQFEDDEWLKRGLPLFVEIDGCMIPFFTDRYRNRGKENTWLVTIKDYGDVFGAQLLERREVYGNREEVMEICEDFELSGTSDPTGLILTVPDRGKIGEITDFDDSTENLLLEVELEDGRKITLPLNFDWITSEDDESMEVEFPEGILDALLSEDF